MKIDRTTFRSAAKRTAADRSRAPEHETVLFAAVRASNGKIVCGHRHIDAISTLQKMHGYEREQPDGQNQGFVTSEGRFVSREEAYRIHFPTAIEIGNLQSDDL